MVRRPLILILIALTVWFGLAVCVPHTHGHGDVERVVDPCPAAGSGHVGRHVHAAPSARGQQTCLACAVGGSSVAPPAGAFDVRPTPYSLRVAWSGEHRCDGTGTPLLRLRGPPTFV
jgi:hypothetical protein